MNGKSVEPSANPGKKGKKDNRGLPYPTQAKHFYPTKKDSLCCKDRESFESYKQSV